MSNAEAIKKLIDAGATHEKKEDGEGVTRGIIQCLAWSHRSDGGRLCVI